MRIEKKNAYIPHICQDAYAKRNTHMQKTDRYAKDRHIRLKAATYATKNISRKVDELM